MKLLPLAASALMALLAAACAPTPYYYQPAPVAPVEPAPLIPYTQAPVVTSPPVHRRVVYRRYHRRHHVRCRCLPANASATPPPQ